MPLSSALTGVESKPYVAMLDNRWAMNYAASIEDFNPVLYDTFQPTLPVHPMYLAHPEWEAMKPMLPELGLTSAELATSVEMSHDTVMARPLVAGMTLSTTAEIAGIERHRAGALITYSMRTCEEGGDVMGTTMVRALFRGVEVDGDDRPAPATTHVATELPAVPDTVEIPIGATACHVYSECARIWNPIHTDPKIADDAGLPGLILHGTATLAKVTSVLCEQVPGMEIAQVTRISADLRAMVLAPSVTVLRYGRPQPGSENISTLSFQLINDEGGHALTRGSVSYTNNSNS